jgi:nucleoside-diphosphate-sugar epimerase
VGVRCFLHASTGSVCTQVRRAARESDAIDLRATRSFYVASKLAGEILLGPYEALFPVIMLRLYTVYGPGQSPDMLLPRLVRRVQEGQPIQLEGSDGLTINPVSATDVAETLCRCLALDRSATLNVAGPELLTLRQVGESIGRVVNREPLFECLPERTAPVIAGDTSALRSALGWTPPTRFEKGLRDWLARVAPALQKSA